jgi:8-oxo-dGTP pyrophosphatase MutT (NUDIX family)
MADTVRAAGAVLWRPAAAGIEVCVVHRPAYSDWSLPKGKLEHGEHPLPAALREVREETGVTGLPEVRLDDVEYTLPDGTPKTVQFWSMRADERRPVVPVADPTEVDALAWLSPEHAAGQLTYEADRALVARVAALPPITMQTLVVRHATAGERKKWTGDDALRPIDDEGRHQAAGLGEVLAPFAPHRLYAATPLRCKQTLEPLAQAAGLPIVIDSAFAEPADAADAPAKGKLAAARLLELRGERAGICSQGKMIPPMLAALQGADDPAPYRTPKGGGWVLSWSDGKLAALSRL